MSACLFDSYLLDRHIHVTLADQRPPDVSVYHGRIRRPSVDVRHKLTPPSLVAATQPSTRALFELRRVDLRYARSFRVPSNAAVLDTSYRYVCRRNRFRDRARLY
jgi:hypothetical protein